MLQASTMHDGVHTLSLTHTYNINTYTGAISILQKGQVRASVPRPDVTYFTSHAHTHTHTQVSLSGQWEDNFSSSSILYTKAAFSPN